MMLSSRENEGRTRVTVFFSDGRLPEGWVLVTMDKDFGEFLFVERAPHHGMVRLPDVSAAPLLS